MKKVMMLSIAAASLMAASAVVANAADTASDLRDAAQAADSAATAKNAELNAGASANAEQAKADAEGAAASASTTTVGGAIKHRAAQAGHKVKAVADKTSAKYHSAVATHDENKAAADVSASMSTGQ